MTDTSTLREARNKVHTLRLFGPITDPLVKKSDVLAILDAQTEQPKIEAIFETVDGDIPVTGKTQAPIKRIEQQDGGSFMVVIDHWPSDAPTDNPALVEALRPFGLISTEGVVTQASGHVTITTCAEFFHRAAAALASREAKPGPDAVGEDWREIKQARQPRLGDGYTAVRISKPGFWLVKGPGPATAFPNGAAHEQAT